MNEVVFSTAQTPSPTTSNDVAMPKRGLEPVPETKTEYPYSEYEGQKHRPYVVDYFDLGELWEMGEEYSSPWSNEVEVINKHLKGQIAKGEVNDTVESVKNELKRIEKLVNVKVDARSSARMALVAEYIKFLDRTKEIKRDAAKYGLT